MKRSEEHRDPQLNRTAKRGRKRMWWTLMLLVPAVVIFTAADRAADAVPCRALDIEVDQVEGMYFVDAPTLHDIVTERHDLLDRPMGSLPLADLHATIVGQHGVATCMLEPTLGGALRIRVTQQRPLARVWLPDSVLYLDERGMEMPLSTRYTADVPVVHAPSLPMARAAFPLLERMDADPFWDRFIDQVEIGTDGQVNIRPRIGDLVIELGKATDLPSALDSRLARLKTFYTELIRRGDLRQYRRISLQYADQLVASK